jgi:hypothetical protein
MEAGMTDAVDSFINHLVGLAQQAQSDPLCAILSARLGGETGVPIGLKDMQVLSPSLGPDEASPTTILYMAYKEIEQTANTEALTRFRQCLVSLLNQEIQHALPQDRTRLYALGHLLAYSRLSCDTSGLAGGVRRMLWGFLTSELPKPMSEFAGLDDAGLADACFALDLWLALTPPQEALQEHHQQALIKGFHACRESFAGSAASRDRTKLLLLLYRALVKIMPSHKATAVAYWQLGELAAHVPEFAPAWKGQSAKYILTFAAVTDPLADDRVTRWWNAWATTLKNTPIPKDISDAAYRYGKEAFDRFGAKGEGIISDKPAEIQNVIPFPPHPARAA